MLTSLYVRNFAIIDELSVSFENNFTVITGETGAGKSILVNAILLLTGNKVDNSFLKDKQQKAIIEATFQTSDEHLCSVLKEFEIEIQPEIIIRREILPSGTSRQYVNDCVVTLNTLKEITIQLIDVHSQHHNILLKQQTFQLQLIDSKANLNKELAQYKKLYNELKDFQRQLKTLLEQQEEQKKKADFWFFQQKEFEPLIWTTEEFQELESNYLTLEHAEEILEKLAELYTLLYQDDLSVLQQLKSSEKTLVSISDKLPKAGQWNNSIRSCIEEIKEISKEIINTKEAIQINTEQLQQLQSQTDYVYKLLQKYRLTSYDELLHLKQEVRKNIENLTSYDEQVIELQSKISLLEKEVLNLAEELHQKRCQAAKEIEKPITEKLQSLGMPHATFKINIFKTDELNDNGCTGIQFFFSANPKISVQPMDKIASGGELSRLLLTLKCLNTAKHSPETILLDEADTGISGEIAYKAGIIMKEMAANKQVIAITHLPQVAACAKHHLCVQKQTIANEVKVIINKLNKEERIAEIAKLLSTDEITKSALEQAEYLLNSNLSD